MLNKAYDVKILYNNSNKNNNGTHYTCLKTAINALLMDVIVHCLGLNFGGCEFLYDHLLNF